MEDGGSFDLCTWRYLHTLTNFFIVKGEVSLEISKFHVDPGTATRTDTD